jgi:hypothetical protein
VKRFKPKKSKPLPKCPSMKDIIRFLSHVEVGLIPPDHKTPCWYFTGGNDASGYGRFRFADTTQWANRFSLQAFKGKLPRGHEAGHTCHDPRCVNPDHLTDQTKSENSREVRLREKANGHPGNGTKNGVPHNKQDCDMPSDYLA